MQMRVVQTDLIFGVFFSLFSELQIDEFNGVTKGRSKILYKYFSFIYLANVHSPLSPLPSPTKSEIIFVILLNRQVAWTRSRELEIELLYIANFNISKKLYIHKLFL